MARSNERTFQGILLNAINNICKENSDFNFSRITQEEQVGIKGTSRFSDGILYSSLDKSKAVNFELKNLKWDATDEVLVQDAHQKASMKGYPYFVTGTPRQLVIYKTFEVGTTIFDRKLKIYNISRIKKIDSVLSKEYENEIIANLKDFLKELNYLLHNIKIIIWTSIDEFFVNKLSNNILEATENMLDVMYPKIRKNKAFQSRIREYLVEQDIFNVSIHFEQEDIYNLCQLANYLLYLKIIFYSYLQREVPSLNLQKLEIPNNSILLNETLQKSFEDVLKYDFEMIFEPSVLDEFVFPNNYLSIFQKNIEEINNLNFKEINADIIGAIYNTLIDNQEQHDRGQHFTNTNEVDIICGFCIDKNTHFILDPGCGAGTFLVRAYIFLKYFNKNFTHQDILGRLWGIDIASFPTFLATMNLSLLNISCIENYPTIIQKDFATISSNSYFKMLMPISTKELEVKQIDNKTKQVKIPFFDACIGNPPYIRQELIGNKKIWLELAKKEFGIKKINQQSDLYVYYLLHSAAFLKDGKRLGFVISASWLNTIFGAGLQKFLLDNFKIIAILDNQKQRSFETAAINTIILIIEKCSNFEERQKNNVKFIRIFKNYKDFIGTINDKDRLEKVVDFVNNLTNIKEEIFKEDFHIIIKNQAELEKESTFSGKYHNGYWNTKYIRAPKIYKKYLSKGNGNFIMLSEVCGVFYGIKSGMNDFFYLTDDSLALFSKNETDLFDLLGERIENKDLFFKKYGWYYSELMKRHYLIEKKFIKPIFKSQKEANNLDVDISKLKNCVLICNYSKSHLKNYRYRVLKYILDAEKSVKAPQDCPTCKNRISEASGRDWYMLGENLEIGDFIFPSNIGERYRLIDNRNAKVLIDKVNYNVKVNQEYKEYSDIIFTLLNSISLRYFLDLFSNQLTGNLTLSVVDVNVLQKILIPNPKIFKNQKENLLKIYQSIKAREQQSIFQEIQMEDKKFLDEIIFKKIGLEKEDVDELFFEAAKFVRERQIKSDSVNKTKVRKKLDFSGTLELFKERFDNIRSYNQLVENMEYKEYYSHNLKVKFPSNYKLRVNDMFEQKFFVHYIIDENRKYTLSFENIEQLMLFEYLVKKIGVKEKSLKIPVKPKDATEVLEAISNDYELNIDLMREVRKNRRISFSENIIYIELLFN